MVSSFGKYQGYTDPIYDGYKRTSEYLTLSDGTRLAYDLIIPTQKGISADKPLPTLFKYTPYGRTWTIFDKSGKFLLGDFVDFPTQVMARIRYWIMGDKGRIMDPLWRDKWLDPVIKHGYIVLSVDRPGTGASFSSPTPGSMETAAKFIPDDLASPILLMQSMWVLLETKRLDEAKRIFGRCRELEEGAGGAGLSYLLTAMAGYCQQTGQLAEAERYWLRSSELDEPMLPNALSGLVKIQAVRALGHVRCGLEQIQKFKGNNCKVTMTMLPGNHDQLLADARKELETYRETLEKMVPQSDLWRFGIGK